MNEKICGICGDRAVGYNFSALTCESCRSFFRRNASRAEEYKCFFGDNCEITCVTRKFCKKCRLNKCFDNGMRKESILSEEERELRRGRKRTLNANEVIDSTTDTSLVAQGLEMSRNSNNSDIDIERSLDIPRLIRQLIFKFNELEMSRLKELFSATTVLRDPYNTTTHISETTEFSDAFKVIQNRCDLKCRRVVKMSTNLSEFTNMCEDDKIALLKAGCPEIICLISVINFNFDGEYWTIAINENNATTLKINLFSHVSSNLYEAHRTFLRSLKEEYDSDINVLDLLSAIILFNPNQQNLIHKDIIKLQQQTYIYLLKRYLELKYNSKCEAQSRYVGLMNNLQELSALNRLHRHCLETQSQNQTGPLVEEIYELKPKIH